MPYLVALTQAPASVIFLVGTRRDLLRTKTLTVPSSSSSAPRQPEVAAAAEEHPLLQDIMYSVSDGESRAVENIRSELNVLRSVAYGLSLLVNLSM